MAGAIFQRSNADLGGVRGVDALPRSIYLDANANAPATAATKRAIMRALETATNPSSAHGGGEEGRVVLAAARDAVGALCDGLYPEDVVFTSGCTEANNLVVSSALATQSALITTAVEHPSLLRAAEALQAAGGRLVVLPVDGKGIVDLEALEVALAATSGPAFVSVQAANSETGVLQPLATIASMVSQRAHTLFHSDAAQAFGKIDLVLGQGRGPDVISVSAHKLHGPMGVGALLLREGEERLRPTLLGGDQERRLRAGTQAVPLIAGFGAACSERQANLCADVARMKTLRDQLERGVYAALPGIVINGADAPRLPNTSNVYFPGVEAMALIAVLDQAGVYASQGSACHAMRPEPSPVLVAMGRTEEEAFSAVRFSVSPLNTEAEVDASILAIVEACRRLGVRA